MLKILVGLSVVFSAGLGSFFTGHFLTKDLIIDPQLSGFSKTMIGSVVLSSIIIFIIFLYSIGNLLTSFKGF